MSRPTIRNKNGYVKGFVGQQKVHGLSGSSTFKCWDHMMYRCYVNTSPSYKDYGGRGIVVCKRWHSFVNFWADMGLRPDGFTLDRFPNPNGDYSPDNCRWASPQQQSDNKRNTIHLTINGVTKTLTEWASSLGIPRHNVWRRLRRGWTPEEAVFLEGRRKCPHVSI